MPAPPLIPGRRRAGANRGVAARTEYRRPWRGTEQPRWLRPTPDADRPAARDPPRREALRWWDRTRPGRRHALPPGGQDNATSVPRAVAVRVFRLASETPFTS